MHATIVRRSRSAPGPCPGKTEGAILPEVALADMSEDEFAQRYRVMQKYVGWTDDDARRVAALSSLVMPHAQVLIDDFYAEIQLHPEAARVITGGAEQIERLKGTLREWLAQLLGGRYDAAYMSRRWKVGHRHVEIGLAQRYTSLALSRLRTGIARRLWNAWTGAQEELADSLASLNKLLDIDHALIQDAYEFEHVRRERLLERERSERMFRHLVESASCLVVILNAESDVVYFNPYAEAATGYEAAEVRSHPGRVLNFLGRDEEEARRRLRQTLAEGVRLSYETRVTPRAGPPRWISWTLSRMADFAQGPAILAVGHDVTEQRHAAAQLLQASRLATIGEMYARLAHESRNALQRLRVCTEMLADHVGDQSGAASLLDRSQRAQDDLQRLLDEVRNFAAPMTLEITECRLAGLWREAWSLLQVARRDRKTKLDDEDCDPSLSVQVDRFRLVQAFRNIFENSLAACDDPAVIRIRCQQAQGPEQPVLELIIEDNGPGFSSEALERVFEPFFTTKSTGTGLGLSIVHRIVEAHGGRVEASHAAPRGAQLRIILPIESARSNQSDRHA
jgi:PAS domain S-box-containing protein